MHEPCHPWTLHSLIRFCNCYTVESAFRFSEMMLEHLLPILNCTSLAMNIDVLLLRRLQSLNQNTLITFDMKRHCRPVETNNLQRKDAASVVSSTIAMGVVVSVICSCTQRVLRYHVGTVCNRWLLASHPGICQVALHYMDCIQPGGNSDEMMRGLGGETNRDRSNCMGYEGRQIRAGRAV